MSRTLTIATGLALASILMLGSAMSALLLEDDDGGTGGDAGDSLSDAISIDGTGTIEGVISDLDDSDWYEWSGAHADSATCVQLDAGGNLHADAKLVREVGSERRRVTDVVTPNHSAATAQTFTGDATWYVGMEANPETADSDEEVTGEYVLNLTRLDAGNVTSDAGSGTDAASQPWQKNVIAPEHGCLGGTLGTDGDDKDVYSVEAYDGDTLQVGLQDVPANGSDGEVHLRVLDPDYDEVLTIGPGELGNVSVDTNGTWYLQSFSTTTSYDGTYLVSIGQIEWPPCRPSC